MAAAEAGGRGPRAAAGQALIQQFRETVGFSGVVALLVGQRTREFGIRLALGATAGDLGRLGAREGGLLIGLGLAIGGAVSLYAGRALDELLIGVQPHDLATFATVGVVLSLAALAACLAPARRAAHIDPVHALRQE